jgi:hypothetical protein
VDVYSLEGRVDRLEEVCSSKEHGSSPRPRDRIAGSSAEEDRGQAYPSQNDKRPSLRLE